MLLMMATYGFGAAEVLHVSLEGVDWKNSRYITSNLKMKRGVLDAFWKRAGLTKTSGRGWRPSTKLLAFLQSV